MGTGEKMGMKMEMAIGWTAIGWGWGWAWAWDEGGGRDGMEIGTAMGTGVEMGTG